MKNFNFFLFVIENIILEIKNYIFNRYILV